MGKCGTGTAVWRALGVGAAASAALVWAGTDTGPAGRQGTRGVRPPTCEVAPVRPGPKETRMESARRPIAKQPLPPIDAAAPVRTETATFALG